ncbi:hypothetical protein N5079_11975 [Planotetraspora sp. A-T 1434]|uniref:hypothetical protein n=1 Tax=Planotetraspora sp. A-T 1434 TaxID=2979219 RepID=UPI0021BE64CA|nr:hypothetical protein [Planotetraspora sp. A-T 1434]MCT9930937.1 hypothetical protein [Planotetraspora sp. A-T 1434]
MISIDVPAWAARLRALRRGRLWRRRDLGERMAVSADEESRDHLPPLETLTRTIEQWEAGVRRPGEEQAELLCRAFGVTEQELFVGEALGTTFWHHVTGVPLLPAMFAPEDEERTGRAIERPERADDATVRYFEAVLDAYTRADLRPGDLAGVLRPLLAGIETFHRDAGSRVRRALLPLASRNAELISRMRHEAGDAEGALAWSDEAVRDAREAADTLIESYALAQRAGLVDTAAGPRELVEIAVAARAHGHIPARVDALSRWHEAQGHALAGEEDLCHRCLEESAQSLAEPGEDLPYQVDTSAEAHKALCAGCLVDLGHAGGAIEILEHGPTRPRTGYARAYTMALMAHAYADAHERERSADLAHEALALARRTGAARALRELSRVRLPRAASARRRILL